MNIEWANFVLNLVPLIVLSIVSFLLKKVNQLRENEIRHINTRLDDIVTRLGRLEEIRMTQRDGG